MAFVDLEKAFDRVPREVVWWALRSLGVDEWLVTVIKAMYADKSTMVKLNGRVNEGFGLKGGVHQGTVLSPLLFIIVLEALSSSFRGATVQFWFCWQIEDLLVEMWKAGMEDWREKRLRMNVGKIKVIRCYDGASQV